KYLSMVESEKGKAKLMTSDEMVEYVLAKYGKKYNLEDEIDYVILEDLRIKYRKKRLEGDLARAIKAKQAKHDKGKAKQAEHDLDDVLFLKAKKENEAKEAELKVKKEVVEVSSDEGFSGDEDIVLAPTASTSTFKASIRSRALIASTSNAQTASTAPRRYRKIAMTGCVLGLRAPDDPNAPPPSAT
ncbi:hypothetical protein Tco_1422651, partial [Tanacetum coccineum]